MESKSTIARAVYLGKVRQIAVIKENDKIKKVSVEQPEFYFDLELNEFISLMSEIIDVCQSEGIWEEILNAVAKANKGESNSTDEVKKMVSKY